jgi:hypothetical protein
MRLNPAIKISTNHGSRCFRAVLMLAACLAAAATGEGADITLTGGNVTLTISTATAGLNPDQATDNTCTLTWTTLAGDPVQKITIESDLLTPRFTLRAQALGVTSGTSMGLVPVSTSTDFITNIPANTSDGQATLGYQAGATAAQGTGSDVHTIKYTITAQ